MSVLTKTSAINLASNGISSTSVIAGAAPGLIPGDSGFGAQWHLGNKIHPGVDLNVTGVWDDYRGDGVVVAIVDTGIDYGHPDLAANYRHDLDFDARDHDMDSFASTAGDDHGTVVAGVVAAALGGGDTVGVAPGAQVTGFRMGFGADSTIGQVATQMQNMATVDVANNSWSYGGFFVDNLDNPDFSAAGSAMAPRSATTTRKSPWAGACRRPARPSPMSASSPRPWLAAMSPTPGARCSTARPTPISWAGSPSG